MKAQVDEALCVGCGLCIQLCPEVFARSPEKTAYVTVTAVGIDDELACREAADACPVDAVALRSE